ncbi:MAG: sigma-70 family RNA polymerase sigma factor [Archangiaceae bacterium]|nr:sigma-70 family RNA polymerase sigma factor [Archangiaceae bacterium]
MENALPTSVAAAPLELEQVFRAHAGDVTRWAARLGGPSVDLEDTVQNVFMTVQRSLPAFDGRRAKLSTWLYRITENEVRHRRRRDAFRRWLRGSAEDAAGELPAEEESADDALERHQRTVRFYRVLDRMRERPRTVLVLFELEELSGEEIAELLGLKVGAVWVALHRARADFLTQMNQLIAEESK